MPQAFNILIFLTVGINLFAGIAIVVRNYKSLTNRFFAAFVVFLSVWIICNFFENEPGLVGLSNVPLFLKLDFFFAPLFFSSWFHFCREFSYSLVDKKRRRRYLDISSYIAAVVAAVLALFSNLIITDIGFDGVVIFKEGPLLLPYFLLILTYSIAGLVILRLGVRRALRSRQNLARQQMSLIFWGYLMSITNLQVINFLQPFYPISVNVSRFGLYGLTLISLLTAYAITRRSMFDLKPLVARAVSFIIFSAFFAAVYAGAFTLAVDGATRIHTSMAEKLFFFLVTVVAMLTFQPLEAFTRRITNGVFFKGRYDSEKLLYQLTRVMAEKIDLDILSDRLLKVLLESMHVTKGAFLVVREHKIIDSKSIGYTKTDTNFDFLFHADSPVESSLFLIGDLSEGSVKDSFRKEDIELAMPIKVGNTEVAILVLGSKLSGEAYYQQDINFLKIFASEAGIAIQNAMTYEELKKLNQELESRVMTRTKELEESQGRALAQARELVRIKDEFVFLAAHELRTPITAIRGFLELTREAYKDFPKDIQSNLDAINSASEQLNQLINDLLEIARSDSGVMRITVTPHDPKPIILGVMAEVESLTKQKNIKTEVSIGESGKVMCDPTKLKEVLLNLVGNAIKYNRDGGEVHVKGFQTPGQPFYTIEVVDNGFGIPKDQQERIFQKFFRAGTKGTEEVLGTGLGLFLARMLVEKMGGQIGFSSVEQQGATFSFSLPMANG